MDSFTVATQNQLSFNKMLEIQIQHPLHQFQVKVMGLLLRPPIQESVRSIITMFKEKALKSTEGSLGGVSRDKKPSGAENFVTKFFRRVKNSTPAATNSPVALAA
jgi:hypothetical protein